MNWNHIEPGEVRISRRSMTPPPSQVDIDALASVNTSDEDLANRFKSLNDERNHVIEGGRTDPTPWEVEMAYVRREQQIRRIRRLKHAEFLKADDEFKRQDAFLPAGDFDNFAFVYAVSGGRCR